MSADRLPHRVARFVGWAAAIFYRVERVGPHVPDGPVLVAANHTNALLDPLIVFRAAGRNARPLAKAPLFSHPLVGPFLRALGGLPVYRRRDDETRMHENEDMFRAAVAALHAGEAVQIYPEGQSHSEPALTPLRTGAARIALRAEVEAEWRLGLRIVPLGLTFTRMPYFRGRALAWAGEPFGIVHHRDAYEREPAAAVRALTAELAARLEQVTLNLLARDDLPLLEAAERLYAREKGEAEWRAPDELAPRVPRLQRAARALAWLRANEPARSAALEARVRRYARLTGRMGVTEGDVPPRYDPRGVVRYALREGGRLLLGAPLAALGTLFSLPPYLLTRLIAARLRLNPDEIATWKFAIAFLAFPLAWVAWIALAWALVGPLGALAAALALPPLALHALSWRERWQQMREDARVLSSVLLHPRDHARLAAERRRLTREFDAILAAAEPGVSPA